MDNTTKLLSLAWKDLVHLVNILQKYRWLLVLILISALCAAASCTWKQDVSWCGPLVWPILTTSRTNAFLFVKITEWSLWKQHKMYIHHRRHSDVQTPVSPSSSFPGLFFFFSSPFFFYCGSFLVLSIYSLQRSKQNKTNLVLKYLILKLDYP